MINRRLYLESPIEIQRLLIVPYKLGTIIAENNRQIETTLQRAQDNNRDISTYWKTIVTRKTITRRDNKKGTNNNHRPTRGPGKYRDNSN